MIWNVPLLLWFAIFIALIGACEPLPGDEVRGMVAGAPDENDVRCGQSPGWQIPITVERGEQIFVFGVIEEDTIERDIIYRLVEPATWPAVDVLAGPVTEALAIGYQRSGTQTQNVAASELVILQIWRPNLPAANNGHLIGGWLETDRRTFAVSALLGNGAGAPSGYLVPSIDWDECPPCTFDECL